MLNQLLEAYKPEALQEVREVKGFANRYGRKNFDLMPWDWSYYSDKLKNAKYDLNDEMLKPLFRTESSKKGVFGLAARLYGLKFKKNNKIPYIIRKLKLLKF